MRYRNPADDLFRRELQISEVDAPVGALGFVGDILDCQRKIRFTFGDGRLQHHGDLRHLDEKRAVGVEGDGIIGPNFFVCGRFIILDRISRYSEAVDMDLVAAERAYDIRDPLLIEDDRLHRREAVRVGIVGELRALFEIIDRIVTVAEPHSDGVGMAALMLVYGTDEGVACQQRAVGIVDPVDAVEVGWCEDSAVHALDAQGESDRL